MPNFSTFPFLGGYIGSCSILLQLFQPWGGGTSVVALSCFNSSTFLILGCGRGTLDIHSILLQLFQSWGEYIGSCSILLQLFQFWDEGGTSEVHSASPFPLLVGYIRHSLYLASTFSILRGYIGRLLYLASTFPILGGEYICR